MFFTTFFFMPTEGCSVTVQASCTKIHRDNTPIRYCSEKLSCHLINNSFYTHRTPLRWHEKKSDGKRKSHVYPNIK